MQRLKESQAQNLFEFGNKSQMSFGRNKRTGKSRNLDSQLCDNNDTLIVPESLQNMNMFNSEFNNDNVDNVSRRKTKFDVFKMPSLFAKF